MKIKVPQLYAPKAISFCCELSEISADETYTFDFSNITNYEPFAMLLSSAAIRQFCANKNLAPGQYDANYVNDKNFTYAGHMGYFQSAGFPLGRMPGEAPGGGTYIPLTKINVEQWIQNSIQAGRCLEQVDIIESESKGLARVLGQKNPELCKLFQYLIREAIRNVPEHAGTSEVWICGQYWRNRPGHPAEIAILDEGMGIMQSLCRNKRHREFISNNTEALEWAIKPGVSASFDPGKGDKGNNPNANSGYGLYIISEICRMTGGRFILLSETDCLDVFPYSFYKRTTNFHGTAVAIRINTERIQNYQEVIDAARKRGEETAKTIKNAFKQASIPSKGLLSE